MIITQMDASSFVIDDLAKFNNENNFTEEFDSQNYLVLRRGCNFHFVLNLSSLRTHIKPKDVTVELCRGNIASFMNETKFQGIYTEKSSCKRQHQWKMEIINDDDHNTMRYSLRIPPNAPVGEYDVFVVVPMGRRKPAINKKFDKTFVILFNPWCEYDDVYLSNSDKRNEYVRNENGIIWGGTHDDTFTRHWNFAQFDTASLEAVLYMMNKWELSSEHRKSPVMASRCMAEMVNCNDYDGGILYGHWSMNDIYEGGTHPTHWAGSRAIIHQYVNTKKPVKYAQCWVFGGVLTTVLRTLGIPARPITNYESAHDTGYDRAVDYYFDNVGNQIPSLSRDSIWNFHVWCEIWLQCRSDLEGPFGGWQALDATPQELSDFSETMVVGPAPVYAIKNGLGDTNYDCEFIIGEVNADIKYHYKIHDKFVLMSSNTATVGSYICTKAVGCDDREDITLQYKYPEGSHAERAAMSVGNQNKENQFEVKSQLISKRNVGDHLVFEVGVTSKTATKATVKVIGIVQQTMYTGVVGRELKRETKIIKDHSLSQAVSEFHFKVQSHEYSDMIGEQASIIGTFLICIDDSEVLLTKVPVQLKLPSLNITINKEDIWKQLLLRGGKSADVMISFENPLDIPLTDIEITMDGAGLIHYDKPSIIQCTDHKVVATAKITPRKFSFRHLLRNKATLLVTVNTKQLKGMMGGGSMNILL